MFLIRTFVGADIAAAMSIEGLLGTDAVFARDLQVQERLTTQVADWLDAELAPRGVGVIIEAEHLCMSMRGVAKTGTTTVTAAVRRLFRSNVATREEAMRFVNGRTGRSMRLRGLNARVVQPGTVRTGDAVRVSRTGAAECDEGGENITASGDGLICDVLGPFPADGQNSPNVQLGKDIEDYRKEDDEPKTGE